ncbi:ABC transporter ATP-binding protein [Staphylococcus hominis]|uniref:ABC transporter ATP-binding protein n=1 Tax=Staphylococcus hominis TaxID=1290 RepID=UPI003EB795C6
MINFDNVEIRFGDFVAIKDLNIGIKENEFFTFLGSSGSGKSTTLKALAGFVETSKGQIFLDGKDITKQPVEKREVGMVFQSYALFPSLSVYENIAFGLRVQKKSKKEIDKRVKALAQLIELETKHLQKNISELSGGQQQRVAIARGLAQNPRTLLLDEPLSNLDARLRKQLRQELKKIQRESGITMIYVTHDQDEALSMSDRIAIFNNGVVEQVGTPQEVYNHPKTEYVHQFLGDSIKLTPEIIRLINQQTGSQLNEQLASYIREERITNIKRPESTHAHFQAKIVDYEFLGSLIRFTYAVGEHKFTTFEKSDSKQFIAEDIIGETSTLYINPDNVHQYDQNGKRVVKDNEK